MPLQQSTINNRESSIRGVSTTYNPLGGIHYGAFRELTFPLARTIRGSCRNRFC